MVRCSNFLVDGVETRPYIPHVMLQRSIKEREERPMSQTRPNPAPIPFPADLVLQHARFATGTLLEIQKRTLDLMARQGAEATRLAEEAIGTAGSAGQQSVADGLQLVRTSAERVASALSAAFRAA